MRVQSGRVTGGPSIVHHFERIGREVSNLSCVIIQNRVDSHVKALRQRPVLEPTAGRSTSMVSEHSALKRHLIRDHTISRANHRLILARICLADQARQPARSSASNSHRRSPVVAACVATRCATGASLPLASQLGWHSGAVRIFVSSVKRDLEEERRALPALIRALGHEPVMFEDFGAQLDPSRESCLDGVASSDVYLLLLGPHYGYRFPETDQSATHDELIEARRKGTDTIVFRKEGISPDPDQAAFINQVGDYARGAFWDDYSDVSDLLTKVASAIRRLENVPSPLTYEPLSTPPAVVWKDEWDTGSGWGHGHEHTYVELHVSPLDGSPWSSRQIHHLPDALIGSLRTFGAVPMAAGVEPIATDEHITITVPERDQPLRDGGAPAHFGGVRIAKSGQVSAWTTLPRAQIGAHVDEDAVTSIVTDQLRLVGALNVLSGERFAISVGLAGSMMINVGSNSATSFGLGNDQPIRITPDESVSSAAFSLGAPEIATSLARRLLGSIGR